MRLVVVVPAPRDCGVPQIPQVVRAKVLHVTIAKSHIPSAAMAALGRPPHEIRGKSASHISDGLSPPRKRKGALGVKPERVVAAGFIGVSSPIRVTVLVIRPYGVEREHRPGIPPTVGFHVTIHKRDGA